MRSGLPNLHVCRADSGSKLVVNLAALGMIASACTHVTSTSTIITATPGASLIVSALPPGVTEKMVAAGDSIFHNTSCQECHGADAKGGSRGPDLTDARWTQITGTYGEIVDVVTMGVPIEKVKMAPSNMPPRGGINLTDEQVREVSAYVYSISRR